MFKASESNSGPLLRAAWSGFAVQGHIAVKYLSLAMQSYLSPLTAPGSGSLSCSPFSATHLGAQVHVRPPQSDANPLLAQQSGSLHQDRCVSLAPVGSSRKSSPEPFLVSGDALLSSCHKLPVKHFK